MQVKPFDRVGQWTGLFGVMIRLPKYRPNEVAVSLYGLLLHPAGIIPNSDDYWQGEPKIILHFR